MFFCCEAAPFGLGITDYGINHTGSTDSHDELTRRHQRIDNGLENDLQVFTSCMQHQRKHLGRSSSNKQAIEAVVVLRII